MKKLRYLLVFACFAVVYFAQAQQVPQGMKYQAVARSLSGEVLANQPVTLKISLTSKAAASSKIHYSETHTVTTNALGLFDLTIGAGKVGSGTFRSVPWSTEDIWMEIAIQDGGKSGFSTVSNSRLLAVPYAFHALTANQLANNPNARAAAGPTDGVPSNVWSTFGNTRTNPATDRMGTMDYVDLIFVTNALERLRITKDGDINIANSLKVGKDAEIGNNLTVKKDVFLNTAGGSTTNNGPLTVANGSATKLTGTLDVDKATNLNSTLNVVGASTLKNTLTVDGATQLKNTLAVDGATNLNSSLSVNNGAATKLTGTLLVEKDGTFKQKIVLDNASLGSTSPTTGALVVAGGVGIGQNLNVAGNANFGGSTTFGGIVNITDGTESTATTNGALIVAGGVGIGKRLNVGGATNLSNTLNVVGATTLKNTLGVDGAGDFKSTLNVVGATTLKNTLSVDGAGDFNSTLNVDGATTLNSTVTVTGETTLSNKLNANGQVTINADVNGADSEYGSYPLRVQGSNQGIAIKVDGSRDNSTNFVTFMDANGTWGRIEGQTTSELEDSREYKTQVALYALEGVATAADIAGLAVEGAGLAAAVITIPAAVGVAAQAAAVVIRAAALVTESVIWSDDVHANVGVAYESGNGDYAEWLERGAKETDMIFGQIVGVRGGKLSIRTDSADHYMVVSRKPIVLGNMPPANREKDYEKVAFMGQVPVRVVGKVTIGDYVIPSGNHDGLGLAVHPADMKLGDYARIVGVAWQAAKDAPLNIVNVAVGINTNDLTSKLVTMSQRLDSLSQKTDNILAFLAGKAPLQTASKATNAPTSTATGSGVTTAAPAQTTLTKTMSDADFDRAVDKSAPQLIQYFGEAKNQLTAKGIDVNKNPYLAQFFNDPIASVKQLRRDPTLSTQWGRVDQQLQKKTAK